MNILVCVKQVPDTTEIKIDPVRNTLIRDGVPSILNTFDTYALEAAVRIKEQEKDVTLAALCMGPPQAKNVLKECMSVGADKAYLVSGRSYGGSDTLATSYILSEAIKEIEKEIGKVDLIFCGKQAIDGDTAQVGPEIAEHLGIPQITCCLSAELAEGTADGPGAGKSVARVQKETDAGVQILEACLPCMLTFTKPSWNPRKPRLKGKIRANRTEIKVFGDDDLPDIDKARVGLKGSPTKVKRTMVPQQKSGGLKIRETTGKESAKKLYEVLSSAGLV